MADAHTDFSKPFSQIVEEIVLYASILVDSLPTNGVSICDDGIYHALVNRSATNVGSIISAITKPCTKRIWLNRQFYVSISLKWLFARKLETVSMSTLTINAGIEFYGEEIFCLDSSFFLGASIKHNPFMVFMAIDSLSVCKFDNTISHVLWKDMESSLWRAL